MTTFELPPLRVAVRLAPCRRRSCLPALIALAMLLMEVSLVFAQGKIDLAVWEKCRGAVAHPATTIKPADLERARRNIAAYPWARDYAARVRSSADAVLAKLTPAYVERMAERTTPGTYSPCPACRAKGLPWHPNGQWSWSEDRADQITCQICKTTFPNAEFPESLVLQSKWDPEQRFTFVAGEPFNCFGYLALPSPNGVIRGNKLHRLTSQLDTLGTAYALSGEAKYARGAKMILLRFAEVLPKYLVRAGYAYGEIADCDPHTASERIEDLPTDELVTPPNKPNRKLHTGYWSASRVGSSGMDGGWVCRVTGAYDLTCEAREGDVPVYSDAERKRIEKDVLIEGAYLGACDTRINNKSVGNRTGVAMAGMCAGQPEMVRFGIDGFRRTVEEWFLPDGGTSESASYAMMTMGGIRDLALILRDTSDPAGYTAPDGTRIDHFDACRDTRYGDCWQGLVWNLQGDLHFPPSADSYRSTAISSSYAELLALAYPSDEHLALLKELAGGELGASGGSAALFYREPGLEKRAVPGVSLPDVVFPFLSQGYLRTGAAGRDSLTLLSASDWGNHHHQDSLDLYYWNEGHELLSDLGYLWDHPDKHQTATTFAHNTVLIDNREQVTRGRGGSFHLFAVTPRVKVMEASSRAYEAAGVYRRTVVQVDHGEAGSYLVDFFRAQGGREREYVFHGPSGDTQVEGLHLAAPGTEQAAPVPFAVKLHLADVGEFEVEGVEVRPALPGGQAGPNLVAPAEGATGAQPKGWGCYLGDGTAEWGVSAPGQVRFRALKPHENGRMNVALMVGDSDGYRGTRAFAGAAGASYTVRFRIRGNAPSVSVSVVAWPHDANSAEDRYEVGSRRTAAGPEWRAFEATVKLPEAKLALENARRAPGDAPWQATWRVGTDYTFTAFSPGAAGESVTLGDGWGQRDHRNTDRGAKLPYVVRSRSGRGLDIFATVFAGAPAGRQLVKSVRQLPLPAGTPADAMILAVETTLGSDLIYSTTAPGALRAATPLGEMSTDALVGAVLSEAGVKRAAALFGGTRLALGAETLATAPAGQAGKVLGTGGARGESYFILDEPLPAEAVGQTLFVTAGDMRRGYPMRAIREVEGKTLVYTKLENTGFEARPGETWEWVPAGSNDVVGAPPR